MKIVGVIQARTGSSRFPGKVLESIEGRSMLSRVVERARAIEHMDELWVATTTQSADDPIAVICQELQIGCHRGPENDVLARYVETAERSGAEAVIRITADCPLLDTEISSLVVKRFIAAKADYASNTLKRSYPRGLDTEVIHRAVLMQAAHETHDPVDRVHVTPFIYRHPQRFHLAGVHNNVDYCRHRWTVDTPADLEFIRTVYAAMDDIENQGWLEIAKSVDKHPEWSEINREIEQKPLEEG